MHGDARREEARFEHRDEQRQWVFSGRFKNQGGVLQPRRSQQIALLAAYSNFSAFPRMSVTRAIKASHEY